MHFFYIKPYFGRGYKHRQKDKMLSPLQKIAANLPHISRSLKGTEKDQIVQYASHPKLGS